MHAGNVELVCTIFETFNARGIAGLAVLPTDVGNAADRRPVSE
jgi:hypothetical protein